MKSINYLFFMNLNKSHQYLRPHSSVHCKRFIYNLVQSALNDASRPTPVKVITMVHISTLNHNCIYELLNEKLILFLTWLKKPDFVKLYKWEMLPCSQHSDPVPSNSFGSFIYMCCFTFPLNRSEKSLQRKVLF